jgi:hypothetical protein
MLVVSAEEGIGSQKLLFGLSKPKVKELYHYTPGVTYACLLTALLVSWFGVWGFLIFVYSVHALRNEF